VESTARFEGADFLEVLAFEEDVEFGVRGAGA